MDPGPKKLVQNATLGLEYFEELKLKVPREEIARAVDIVRKAVYSLFDFTFQSELQVEGVGSYRRGKAMSGDIDILISTKDGKVRARRASACVRACVRAYF